MRSIYFSILIVFSLVWVGFDSPGNNMDISTPEKSFDAFVKVLQSGESELLEKVATPTGLTSLSESALESYSDKGIVGLGEELASSRQEWLQITEDIYFLTAQHGARTHKMEFTKEEPGWMLYHWQIGGGSDAGSH